MFSKTLVILPFILCHFPIALCAQIIWQETNWQNNNYELMLNLDTEASAGELILKNETSNMVLAFSPTELAGVWDIEEFNGKLFFAACTSPMAVDGGKIYSYDFSTNEVKFEYEVLEQGIIQMRIANNKLYVPGLDSQGSWQFGNIYIFDGTQWTSKSTVPYALHVLDLVYYKNNMLVTTETLRNNISCGTVFQSLNEGDSWDELFSVCTTPNRTQENALQKNYDQNNQLELLSADSRRLFFMGEYNQKLFVQSDLHEPEGKVLFCYDGQSWSNIALENLVFSYGIFKTYQDKLYFLNKNYLHIFDGVSWSSIALPFSGGVIARSLAAYKNNLFSGAENGRLYKSATGLNWNLESILGNGSDEIESIGTHHGRLYVGTNGDLGKVFVSAALPTGYLISKKHNFGREICSGEISWQALTLPDITSVKFQIRSAESEQALDGKNFVGPHNIEESFYTNSGETINPAHAADQWLQYKVILTTNDISLMPVLEDVTIKLDQITNTLSLSGNTSYYYSRVPVPQVLLTLSHNKKDSTYANSFGSFAFFNLKPNQDYLLRPTKFGDISSTTIISYDASLAARMAIGLFHENTAEQRLAADVDTNGKIQMFDAALIARYAVGLSALPTSCCGEWLFAPESMHYLSLNSNIENANFLAIVLGDVDGNWMSFTDLNKELTAQNYLDNISQATSLKNGEICLPFFSELEEPVYSFDLFLKYEVSKFKYVGYALAENCRHFKITVNDSSQEFLKIGGYGTYPLAQSGIFIELKFKLINKGTINFHFEVENFFLNDKYRASGLITVVGQPRLPQNCSQFKLCQNSPNPCNPFTEIRFELTEACWVKLDIYDGIGRLVKNLINETKSAGCFSVLWQGENERGERLSSGLYFYRLAAGRFSQTHKMLLLR